MVRTLLVLLLAASSVQAAPRRPTRAELATRAARRYPQPVSVGQLLHREVLQASENQAVLGRVAAVVRDADGTVEAVIDFGGLLGIGTRRIAVPMDAMVLVGADMEVADFKPAELRGFPVFDPAGTMALAPGEVIRVGLAKPSH